MEERPVLLPTLAEVVGVLDALGIRYWRWPGGRLATWPPPPYELAPALRAYKQALLDVADTRGAEPPEWARSPDAEGWYDPPGDDQIRLLPEGGYQLRLKPEVVALLGSYTDGEWAAICEACLSDDVEPLFPEGAP